MSLPTLRARLSQAVKDTLSATLFRTGLAQRRSRRQLRRQALILMYHRVLPAERQADSFSSSSIVVTPETFDLHLRLLRREFNPVGPGELLDMLEGRAAFVPNSCLVTFDDGWYDNHEFALPLLRRHGVPAAIFVATSYIGGRRSFWQEEAARRLAHICASPRRAELLAAAEARELLDAPEARLRETIRETIGARKQLPRPALEAWLTRLTEVVAEAGLAPAHFGEDRFMGWDEVRSLRDSGLVTLGSHADSHIPLTALPPAERRAEFDRSRQILERELGTDIDTVAYPDGAHDAETAALARAAGFRLGVTTIGGYAAPGDDTLRLRRVNIYERATHSAPGFMSRITGLF
jgi:peptidoglycan/xylan/chitin deacetylase (PgdA/CDA1 family)